MAVMADPNDKLVIAWFQKHDQLKFLETKIYISFRKLRKFILFKEKKWSKRQLAMFAKKIILFLLSRLCYLFEFRYWLSQIYYRRLRYDRTDIQKINSKEAVKCFLITMDFHEPFV